MKRKERISKRLLKALAITASVVMLLQPVGASAAVNDVTISVIDQNVGSADAQSRDVEATEIVISDEETPLATLEEKQKMSWWWLLIVLVFGTTGAELLRRHQIKKEEANKKND